MIPSVTVGCCPSRRAAARSERPPPPTGRLIPRGRLPAGEGAATIRRRLPAGATAGEPGVKRNVGRGSGPGLPPGSARPPRVPQGIGRGGRCARGRNLLRGGTRRGHWHGGGRAPGPGEPPPAGGGRAASGHVGGLRAPPLYRGTAADERRPGVSLGQPLQAVRAP